MMVSIFVRIVGKIDSRQLWETIEHFGNVNVTDCIAYTLVYGDMYLETASRVIYLCALYGDVEVRVTHKK